MKETLLLIDVQNNYFPSGRMELVYMRETVKKAA
jgi:nicotinamidase-related amidase